MGMELTTGGKKIIQYITDKLQTVNQLAKQAGINWHTASRDLAILLVMDKVHCEVFKKDKKDQYLYRLMEDEVNIDE